MRYNVRSAPAATPVTWPGLGLGLELGLGMGDAGHLAEPQHAVRGGGAWWVYGGVRGGVRVNVHVARAT